MSPMKEYLVSTFIVSTYLIIVLAVGGVLVSVVVESIWP